MKILSIKFKNFASYGNRIQELNFDKDNSELYLTVGQNGSGKCLSGDTVIEVDIENEEIKKEFILFLKDRNLPNPFEPSDI
jgi:ABC-type dipeptide/oligopeptide/nickel transport system ATPase component